MKAIVNLAFFSMVAYFAMWIIAWGVILLWPFAIKFSQTQVVAPMRTAATITVGVLALWLAAWASAFVVHGSPLVRRSIADWIRRKRRKT